MLFQRQRRLLALLDAFSGNVGGVDFQKLLFLYCQEASASPYEFVPYRFGAFSFTSYADKRKLIDRGLLAADERNWTLTGAGQRAAAGVPTETQTMAAFVRRHLRLRGDALVAVAYRQHPYYAIRSEIAARVLARDPVALASIEAARPPAGRPGVSTIGYEGKTLEGYLNQLLQDGVTLLCDVRRNPLSRKYGFSKSTLAKGCEGVGITYEHLPELGIASDERRDLVTQADRDKLFASYERKVLPGSQAALQRIRDWVRDGRRVALTCFERLPEQCHRHCVADALESHFGRAFMPAHL